MRFLRYGVLILISVVLSYTTLVLGAAPLIAVRHLAGRSTFFGLSLVALGALALTGHPEIWAPFALVLALVFYFTELETLGLNLRRASTLALASTAALATAIFFFWCHNRGLEAGAVVRTELESIFKKIAEQQPKMQVNLDMLVPLLPAYFFMLLATTLWFGLLLERRFRFMLGFKLGAKPLTYLTEFKMSDVAIWFAILSLAGSFINLKWPMGQMVSRNVFVIFSYGYFLQGIAVIATMFRSFRVARFWRVLSYGVLVFQLFPAVSLLGLMDYWFDFRERLKRKSPEVI